MKRFLFVLLPAGAASLGCRRSKPQQKKPKRQRPETLVSLSVDAPGYAVEEVEALVTRPLEAQVSTVKGVRRLISRTMEGRSVITAAFGPGADPKEAERAVRAALTTADVLPKDARPPVVMALGPNQSSSWYVLLGEHSPDLLTDLQRNRVAPVLSRRAPSWRQSRAPAGSCGLSETVAVIHHHMRFWIDPL